MNKEGEIGIYFLKDIWAYYYGLKHSPNQAKQVDWKYMNGVFNTLGIGIEPTLKYLMGDSSSFADFESWIKKNGRISQEAVDHFNAIVGKEGHSKSGIAKKIFNEQEIDHWNKEGYVILKAAVLQEDCAATVSYICSQIDVDLSDRTSWYHSHPLRQGIMVQLFNHETLDKNRFSPRIRLAFEQLWGSRDLIVSTDRVSFNPPETNEYQFPGPNLHWDVSLQTPIPFGIQGLLYLTDTDENQGAFTLIPGFHNLIDEWLASLNGSPREVNLLESFTEKPISAKAGDFIFWNHCLPHGSRPNNSTSPRIVQYINYQPIDLEYQSEWV